MSGRNSKAAQVKVKRYRAGQVPEGADINEYYSTSDEEQVKENDQDKNLDEEVDEIHASNTEKQNFNESDKGSKFGISSGMVGGILDKKVITSRYNQRRLEQASESESDEEGSEEKDEEDEEDERRARMRKAALLRQQDSESTNIPQKDLFNGIEEAEEEEESSEYTTESSEEEEAEPMMKPIFVPKSQRVTIQERERKEEEEREAELKKLEDLKQKKIDSRNLVEATVKKELEEAAYQADQLAEIDDTDGLDPEAELQAWKLRELLRLKRDKEEKAEYEAEQAEIERRRNLTEEERLKEDLEKVRIQSEQKALEKSGQQKSLLEKYHHKGAFFMDKEFDVFKRDFTKSRPDTVKNVEALPKPLQVKDFGKASRSKYTHLADQDTTSKDTPWHQFDDITKKNLNKMGGMHDKIDPNLVKRNSSGQDRDRDDKRHRRS